MGGEGITVTGSGSQSNEYVVTSQLAELDTGIDIQVNNVRVAQDIHQLDFRGTGITVVPGTDEAVITVPGLPADPQTVTVPSGTIWMFGATNPPTGWLMCDGATLLIADYQSLFAVISNKFGGDGLTNFAVPNLMDRFPIGASASKPIDSVPGGSATKQIGVPNLPPHQHTINHDHLPRNTNSAGSHTHEVDLSPQDGSSGTIRRGSGTASFGSGPVKSDGAHIHSVNLGMYSGSSGPGGGAGTPIDVMPPWIALGFIMKA